MPYDPSALSNAQKAAAEASAAFREEMAKEVARKKAIADSKKAMDEYLSKRAERDIAMGRIQPVLAQAWLAVQPDQVAAYVELAYDVLMNAVYGFGVVFNGQFEFAGLDASSTAELADMLRGAIGAQPMNLKGIYWLDSLIYQAYTDGDRTKRECVAYALNNQQQPPIPSNLTTEDLFELQRLTGDGPLGN
jgi:hypothetical protein